jgi:5-methylcytosine-specific restriction endonuclease McrA
MKECFRKPVPEINEAAKILNEAVGEYYNGQLAKASALIQQANMQTIRNYTESLWGNNSLHVQIRRTSISEYNPRIDIRMPSALEKAQLLKRDGHHCRFCNAPVIRGEVRRRFVRVFPELNLWGKTNASQHAAFQCMWMQYDHLLPHSKGGTNSLANMVIACAPCNYARMQYTLEEVGLLNPLHREPYRSNWDGLERFK